MKIITKLFLNLVLLLLISSSSNAQFLQIGAGGGLTQILAPSNYTNAVEDGGLGFSTEWNAGAIVKINLPLLPLTPRAYFLYHSLSGSGELTSTNENVETAQSISEIGIGLQYDIIPLPAGFSPYVALDIAYNGFSAIEINGTDVTDSKVSRFGGGIGLGTEITIIPIIDLDVYASYKMFNLIGKDDGEETVSAFTLDVFVLFSFL